MVGNSNNYVNRHVGKGKEKASNHPLTVGDNLLPNMICKTKRAAPMNRKQPVYGFCSGNEPTLLLILNQFIFFCFCNRHRTPLHIKLPKNVLHMIFNRTYRNHQLFGDFFVRQSQSD